MYVLLPIICFYIQILRSDKIRTKIKKEEEKFFFKFIKKYVKNKRLLIVFF